MHPPVWTVLQLLIMTTLVSAHRWYNWQFDLTCETTQYFVPADEEDLADFVKTQYPRQSMLKVVGNGHAFGNMSTCVDVSATNRDSYVISLTNFKSMTINADNTVTFGAGWDLVDIVPMLRSKGLSVINLGTERVQNYIGAFTTGTHGTGRNLGNLATQVVGFRVMNATGAITVINATENPYLLPAYRISLGALGIITEVTIQAEPLTYLKRTTQVFTGSSNITQMYSDIYKLYQMYDRMMVWGPHMTWNTTTSNWTIDPQMSVTYWEETDIRNVYNCSTNYCANGCGQCLRDYFCYDEASDAVSTPPAGVCNRFFYTEIEHFMPVENFVSAATDYTNFQLAEAPKMKDYNNMNMIYELRFVKGDDTWMSPANTYNLGPGNSGVFAVIEIDWYMTYNNFDTLWFYQALAEQFTPQFGLQYNVRPHWGKMSWFNATYAQAVYPALPNFVDLQEYMDPRCQFVNEFLISHLGLTRCLGIFNNPTAAKPPIAKRIAQTVKPALEATILDLGGLSLTETTSIIVIAINAILLVLLYQRGGLSSLKGSTSSEVHQKKA